MKIIQKCILNSTLALIIRTSTDEYIIDTILPAGVYSFKESHVCKVLSHPSLFPRDGLAGGKGKHPREPGGNSLGKLSRV